MENLKGQGLPFSCALHQACSDAAFSSLHRYKERLKKVGEKAEKLAVKKLEVKYKPLMAAEREKVKNCRKEMGMLLQLANQFRGHMQHVSYCGWTCRNFLPDGGAKTSITTLKEFGIPAPPSWATVVCSNAMQIAQANASMAEARA